MVCKSINMHIVGRGASANTNALLLRTAASSSSNSYLDTSNVHVHRNRHGLQSTIICLSTHYVQLICAESKAKTFVRNLSGVLRNWRQSTRWLAYACGALSCHAPTLITMQRPRHHAQNASQETKCFHGCWPRPYCLVDSKRWTRTTRKYNLRTSDPSTNVKPQATRSTTSSTSSRRLWRTLICNTHRKILSA